MTDPVLIAYEPETVTINPLVTETSISLKLTFAVNDGNQECIIFVSPNQSKGKSWVTDATRLMYVVPNTNQTIDISELYLSKFNKAPAAGAKLFASSIFCGKDNGQFSFETKSVLTAEPATPPFSAIKFGRLYNWPAYTNAKEFAPEGWHVITAIERLIILDSMLNYANDGYGNMAYTGKAASSKELWVVSDIPGNVGNNPETNDFSGLNLKPCGFRTGNEFFDFVLLGEYSQYGANAETSSTMSQGFYTEFDDPGFGGLSYAKAYGMPIIYVKNDSTFVDRMIGNDGIVYPTAEIQNYLYTEPPYNENLIVTTQPSAETKYRDGSDIPEITNWEDWTNDTEGARCNYDNDESNVFE